MVRFNAILARCTLVLAFALALTHRSGAQETAPAAEPDSVQEQAAPKPLPHVEELMRAVEQNELAREHSRRNYVYKVEETLDEDSKGGTKQKRHEVHEVQMVDGATVEKVIEREGKPLPPDEQHKQDERAEKELRQLREKRAKMAAEGKQASERGEEIVTLSRILELGSFSNERRVDWHGRPTILLDYTGDPKAKTRNRSEAVIRLLAGTIWVDEASRTLIHLEGRFTDSFKVAGGLFANIHSGTTFMMDRTLVNGEVWLPAQVEAHGGMRVLLLVSFNGSMHRRYFDYHKFGASTIILPGVTKVEEPQAETPVPQRACSIQ